MKKVVFARVALMLVLIGAGAVALLGGRVAPAGGTQLKKPAKTEIVALNAAKRVPVQHVRCRARAGI